MNNIITKELLSEVLNCKVWKVLDVNMHTLRYCIYPNKGDEPSEYMFPINIYELAHLCKRWAEQRNYPLISGASYSDGYKCFVDKFPCDLPVTKSYTSEAEAIFKACQWLLDKDKVCQT